MNWKRNLLTKLVCVFVAIALTGCKTIQSFQKESEIIITNLNPRLVQIPQSRIDTCVAFQKDTAYRFSNDTLTAIITIKDAMVYVQAQLDTLYVPVCDTTIKKETISIQKEVIKNDKVADTEKYILWGAQILQLLLILIGI